MGAMASREVLMLVNEHEWWRDKRRLRLGI